MGEKKLIKNIMTNIVMNNTMTVLEPLLPYLCTGTYTCDMYKKIAECKTQNIEHFLNFCGSVQNKKLYINKYINKKCDNKTYCTQKIRLKIIKKRCEVQMYTCNSFKKLFGSKTDIIIRPIYCNIDKKYHLMSLIINNITKQIYVYDSNNNIKITNYIEHIIDKIIYKNDFKHNYCVVASDQWNKNEIIMNKLSFETLNGNNAQCVINTLLFSHYILLTKKNPSTCINIFGSLDDDHLIRLINNYALFYYIFIS